MSDSDFGPLFRPLPSGQELRDNGIALVDGAEPLAWKAKADAAIATLAASGLEFTAEDVRAIAGDPSRPNAMGAAFNRAAKTGTITYVRHAPSSRPTLHRCAIRVWIGTK